MEPEQGPEAGAVEKEERGYGVGGETEDGGEGSEGEEWGLKWDLHD